MLAKASSEAGRRIESGCVLINCVVAKHLENLIFEAQNQNPVLFFLKFFDTITVIYRKKSGCLSYDYVVVSVW